MRLNPGPHALQYLRFKRDDGAIAFGADVEDVIPSPADDCDEFKEFLVDLVVDVAVFLPGAIAPGFAEDGGGGLPGLVDGELGNLVVAHDGEVALVVEDAAGDHGGGLEVVNGLGEGAALSGGGLAHVEPDLAERAVAGEEFFELGDVEGGVRVGEQVTVALDVGAAGGVMPVDGGVVDTEPKAAAGASFGELLDDVLAIGRGLNDVEVRLLRREHVEAVVVLGGDDDVLHAGSFGESDDGVGVKLGGVEAGCELGVLVARDVRVGHDLLAIALGDGLALPDATEFGVETEVDEHAEAAGLPRGDIGGGGAGLTEG